MYILLVGTETIKHKLWSWNKNQEMLTLILCYHWAMNSCCLKEKKYVLNVV